MTTKIGSLCQYPPKLELAAAASLRLVLLTVALLRAQAVILGRRGYSIAGGRQGDSRRIGLGRWKWVALAASFLVLLNPVFLPYGALLNAVFSRVPSEFVSFENLTLHNIAFVFFELSSTGVAFRNTLILCTSAATIGTVMTGGSAYLPSPEVIAWHKALGFLATAPVAVPGIVLGVGLFLTYTRPPFVLYGTFW